MKIKSRITALVTVLLMLAMQVPFTALAEETTTDIRADLLSPDTLPDGTVDKKYTKQFYFDYSKFNNGFMAYSWSIPENEIPPGLELGGQYSTWQPTLMGTPTKAGTYTFTIEGARTDRVNGEDVRTIAARKTYTLTIKPYPLEINKNSLYSGSEESSYSNTVYEVGNRDVTWSMTLENGGVLPDGLSIDAETGKISWASPVKGKYNLEITATRGEESVSKVLKLIIEPGSGCTHENATKTTRKAATCKENGMADYWYCDTCEGYFLDEDFTRGTSADMLNELYTVGFHSDKIGDDGKCDTCGRTMPIFKKVTSKDEITSCGMYLVVSQIDNKYYTFKAPQENYMSSIEAVEITQNSDGTFSYPKSDTDIMILKTEFAANCGALDAVGRRYSFGTTIDNIPYGFQTTYSDIELCSYKNSKYGYIINLTDEQYAEIASVYSAYWSDNGWDGRYILSAVSSATANGDVSFCFTEPETERLPIELYKLTYTDKIGENGSFTLSDTHSTVTINEEFTAFNNFGSKGLSTVGGLSEAVKPNYVKDVISNNKISGNVSVRTYAKIELTSGTTTTNEKYGYTDINSVRYSVTPMLEIKNESSEELYSGEINDENFDGSEMTVSLCIGNMTNPKQIIHHKTDGTKEYFYNERDEGLQAGQKTFSYDEGSYTGEGTTGHFVTFTIDSFSDIEILDTAKEEPITTGNATVTVPAGGETPSFTAVSDDPSRYSVELLKWVDVENNMDFNKADLTSITSPYYNYKFEAGKKYEVQVCFTAADGYELSYNNNFTINGEKTWWRSNGLIRTYVFVPNTDTVADKNGNKFTVKGYNIDGCTVILALYKEDSHGNSQLVECQIVEYSGSEKTFTTTATDYTSAKVMVWKNLTAIEPVTDAEIVALE